jgi:vitamin B12 transporter
MKLHVPFVPRQRAGAFALGLAASSLAWAQPSTSTLAETVVTATRIDTRSDELVSEVRVIERTAIEASAGRTLPEILALEAGLQFAANGGPGQLSSVFIRGGDARHTILLIDGVRYGSATAGTPIWETLPLEAIERIEVVKGPASALYGADGAAGVVQVFTRKPQEGMRPWASITLGSRSHQRVATGVSGGQGNLTYTLGVQQASDQGNSATNAKQSDFNADRDPFRQGSFNGSLRYRINSDWRVDGSVLYSDGLVHFDDGAVIDARSRIRAALMQAGATGRLAAGWQTELRVGQTRDTSNNVAARYPGSFQTVQDQVTWQNTIDTRAGVMLAGLERRVQSVESSAPYTVTRRTLDAAFVGLNGQADAHSWQLNARQDRNSQFGNGNAGFAGYGYRLSTAWRVHASYGTSFVAPSFNQLYYYGNPSLRPEKGRNRDLGATWTRGVHEVKLVNFDNRIRDAIVNDINYMPQNIGQARIDGWTLGYAGKLEGVTLRASLDRMHPRNEQNGQLLPRRAKEQITLGTDWRTGAWRLGASLLHVGSRFDDTDNTRALAAYTVADLHATWQFATDLSLQAKLNNLTDRAYESAYGYNQPGRSLYLTLRWQPK